MPSSGAVAGVVTDAEVRVGSKIAAWAGAALVDRARDGLPDFAGQRDAARRRLVGAAHADERRGQRHGQFYRNAGRVGARQVGTMKIDAKRGATRAAAQAGKVRHGNTGKWQGRELSPTAGAAANAARLQANHASI